MRSLIGYATLVVIILFSCNNKSNRQYILSIDSLTAKLENAVKNYSTIDSLALVEISEKVKYNCSKIDYQNENINNRVIIPYSRINKAIKIIFKTDIQIKRDLAICKMQINNLLYDINNNLMDTSLIKPSVKNEKKSVNTIVDKMNYNYERVISETSTYDSLNPIIEKLILKTN